MKKILFVFTFLSAFILNSIVFAKTEPIEEESVDNSIVIDRISNGDMDVSISSPVFTFSDSEVKLKFKNPNHTKLLLNKNVVDLIINGEDKRITFVNGEASFIHRFDKSNALTIFVEDFSYTANVTAYPMWVILVPALLIILLIVSRMMKKNKQ